MSHLILGYGYCGYYLAQELLRHHQQVTSVSRQLNKTYQLPQVVHREQDIRNSLSGATTKETYLYYLIPPPPNHDTDVLLEQFIEKNPLNVKKVIYFSSSGVYGNQQGHLVNEDTTCRIQHSRQLSRLDAEHQWINYCKNRDIDILILRVGGIFGPNRLPIEAAHQQIALIEPSQAPLINHIYVRDLARIATLLAGAQTAEQIFNVADGNPQPMGTLQQLVAQILNYSPAYYESWNSAFEKASPMKKEFLLGSKRLNINRLKANLPEIFTFTPIEKAVKKSLKSELSEN
jgi:nucleoside-diphosphate-sugar epimerase